MFGFYCCSLVESQSRIKDSIKEIHFQGTTARISKEIMQKGGLCVVTVESLAILWRNVTNW